MYIPEHITALQVPVRLWAEGISEMFNCLFFLDNRLSEALERALSKNNADHWNNRTIALYQLFMKEDFVQQAALNVVRK